MNVSFEPYIVAKEVSEGFEVFHRDDAAKRKPLLLRYAVRTQQLNQHRTNGKSEAERVIEAIKCQQRVAASRAKHLAPIHYFNEDESGIWYVTDRFRGTAEDWVALGCNPDRLYTIVSDTLAGLSELWRKAKPPRGHGNLRPSNVLLKRGNWLERDRYVLSDLGPQNEDAKAEDTIGQDLQALASIIFLLIKGHPLPPHPLNPEDEWQSLSDQRKRRFSKAQALLWFERCNQFCGYGAT